jgi:BolA protein
VTLIEQVRTRLQSLQPSVLEVYDQSALHAGHQPAGNGDHLHLVICAEIFRNHNTLARHRLIYAALGDLMQGPIHALSIDARLP